MNLFRFAANKIFESEKHHEFREEIDRMTKPMIELPSVREKRLRAEKDELVVKNDELVVKNNELLAKNDELAAKNDTLTAENNALLAELTRLKNLQNQTS